jgi:hypothetical protein
MRTRGAPCVLLIPGVLLTLDPSQLHSCLFSLVLARCPLTTYGDVFGSAGGSWTGAGWGSFGGVTGVSSGSSRGRGSGGSGPGSRFIIFRHALPRNAGLPPGYHPNAVPWPGCPDTAEAACKSMQFRRIGWRPSAETPRMEQFPTPASPHHLVNFRYERLRRSSSTHPSCRSNRRPEGLLSEVPERDA